MAGRFQPPMIAIAAGLLALIAVLAALQYRWLGRISDAERERMTATIDAQARGVAEDFDRELTLAYMLFQSEPLFEPGAAGGRPTRLAARYDRWQTTSRYPQLIRQYYVATVREDRTASLQRFDPATRAVEPAEWPASLSPIRASIVDVKDEKTSDVGRSGEPGNVLFVRSITGPLWESVPALVVPMAPGPLVYLNEPGARGLRAPTATPVLLSYTILVLDRDYVAREMLPALCRRHFRGAGNGFDYQLAVVNLATSEVVYGSSPQFRPDASVSADARADLFQLRGQDFPELAADIRRFAASVVPPGARVEAQTFTLSVPHSAIDRPARGAAPASESASAPRIVVRRAPPALVDHSAAWLPPASEGKPRSTDGVTGGDRGVVMSITNAVGRASAPAKWRLLVKHPSGSLEAAVNSARRRNLLISSSILAVLAASLVMIVVSTRRSQELARQQMEFVAAVSHELRTPLAVIRSAGDNLADGVVLDATQVRQYGTLVRGEGRRLTEMVEQILEFAGIHSGQRTMNAVPVHVGGTIDEVLRASAGLIEGAGIRVDVDIPPDLPPVAGDESALRRVFQNLVGNAIKYGAPGGWIGVSARQAGSMIEVRVSDRGIGIDAADQERIFEPFYRAADVVAAQIQGAGLGLSLVQRIVHAHGGRIAVTSAKGTGSEFTVHLPVAAPQAAGQTVQDPPGPHGPLDDGPAVSPAPRAS